MELAGLADLQSSVGSLRCRRERVVLAAIMVMMMACSSGNPPSGPPRGRVATPAPDEWRYRGDFCRFASDHWVPQLRELNHFLFGGVEAKGLPELVEVMMPPVRQTLLALRDTAPDSEESKFEESVAYFEQVFAILSKRPIPPNEARPDVLAEKVPPRLQDSFHAMHLLLSETCGLDVKAEQGDLP